MSVPPNTRVAPWEDFALRLIAIYKFVKAALALLLGLALLKLMHRDLALFLHNYIAEPLHLDSDADSENHFLKWLFQMAASQTPHSIFLFSLANFFYATVFAIEGAGLYLKKHWAEYMVLVVTGSFLPFEGYLIYNKLEWWKLVLMLGNLLIIVYLVHRLLLDARFKAQVLARQQASSPDASSAGENLKQDHDNEPSQPPSAPKRTTSKVP